MGVGWLEIRISELELLLHGKVNHVIMVEVKWRTRSSALGRSRPRCWLVTLSIWVVKSSKMATGPGRERRQNREIQSSVTEGTQ